MVAASNVLAPVGVGFGALALDSPILWVTLALVAALLLGALIIIWVERWRKRPADQRLSASDQLAHFRRLYDQGLISHAEFVRIRDLLSERMRQEMAIPPPALPELELEPEPGPPTADGKGRDGPPAPG